MQARALRCLMVLCTLLAATVTAQAQSHLKRLQTTQADTMSHIAAAMLGDERFATAETDADGNLKVIVWDMTADGSFDRRSDDTAGRSTRFSLVSLSPAKLVGAVQRHDGGLELINWYVAPSGKITRMGSINAGKIKRLSLAALKEDRVATATQDASGQTKLIVWDTSDAGHWFRRGDHTTSAGTDLGIAALSDTRLATAVRRSDGNLEITAWKVSLAGQLTPGGSAVGGTAKAVRITNTALDRAVTAARMADGRMRIAAWDITEDGKVSFGGAGPLTGQLDEFALAPLGSTKVVTAVRQSDKTLKLITWQVVDHIRRLDDAAAGKISAIGLATLGWDRIVTAVRDSSGQMRVISWADFSVGMLHTFWGPAPTSPTGAASAGAVAPASAAAALKAKDEEADRHEEGLRIAGAAPLAAVASEASEPPEIVRTRRKGAKSPGTSPAAQHVRNPDLGGVDPMIAVGKNYVIVTEDHDIEFLNKTGDKAGEQLDPLTGGVPTHISSSSFFSAFTANKNPDGTVNRNNINRHLRLPPDSAFDKRCDPSDTTMPQPCINEFYDTRVTYDPYRGRFVIVSAARSSKWGLQGFPIYDHTVRRYLAIAVSRGEDPRQGFDQYMTTESNYSDWPRVSIGNGVMVLAHWACKDTDDKPCNSQKGVGRVLLNAGPLRPMAYVLRIDDLMKADPAPRNWKIYPYQTDGGDMVPVHQHGGTDGWSYIVHPTDGGLDLYRFRQPKDDWTGLPALSHASVDLDRGMAGFGEGVHFQNNRLYFGGAYEAAQRVPGKSPARYRGFGMRIDVQPDGFQLGPCPDHCDSFDFGWRDAFDHPGDVWSFELPSLAVNSAGDMLIAYGAVPIKTTGAAAQGARFRVVFADDRGMQHARSLQKGTKLLTDVYCSGSGPESSPTTENMFHVRGVSTACPNDQKDFQDYATAVAEPGGTAFWIAHAAGAKTGTDKKGNDIFGYRLVIARVAPP